MDWVLAAVGATVGRWAFGRLEEETETEAAVRLQRLEPAAEFLPEDPEMAEAALEARRRWPEFVEAVARVRHAELTVCRIPVWTESGFDGAWVAVQKADLDGGMGWRLGSHVRLTGEPEGQPVRVHRGEVLDWSVVDGDRALGGFYRGRG
jgi:uncharacterized protein YegJ (DUF2314 family)